MPTTDPRVDAYIAKAPPFARPIMRHVRAVVHAACPAVTETIKWGMPTFEYHGILAGMAAFKEHAAFGFWKGELVTGPTGKSKDAMWGFGKLKTIKDLPSKRVLTGYVQKAMQLAEAGVKVRRPLKHATKARPVRMPTDLASALRKVPTAKRQFDAFSPSARREYIEWVTDAKRAETRAKRIATTVEWAALGRRMNWKYEAKAKAG
jgi:uncharacterized protein YdeI (YjbR/CyaY-like superfamily)